MPKFDFFPFFTFLVFHVFLKNMYDLSGHGLACSHLCKGPFQLEDCTNCFLIPSEENEQ